MVDFGDGRLASKEERIMSPERKQFIAWIQDEMDKRGWKQAELARRANMAPSQVARVMTGDRGAGMEFYKGVARAFRISIEEVLRTAGVLPAITSKDTTVTRLIERLERLPPHMRTAVLQAWEASVTLADDVNGELKRFERVNRLLSALPPNQWADTLREFEDRLAASNAEEENEETPPDDEALNG